MNMVAHVEIPVLNLERAMTFYALVFGVAFSEVITLHGNRMAHVPFTDGQEGASVALAQGEIYKPSHDGAVVYFNIGNIEEVLQRAGDAGSRVLFPKTDAGNGILVAEIEDSEGKRIALQQMPR